MHLSDIGSGSRPPDRGCIVHHRMKGVLKKHNILCGGLATRGPYMPSLGCSFFFLGVLFFSNVIHVSCVLRITPRY